MKNVNRQILLFSLVIIIASLLAVEVFTLPAFISRFNLTDKNNIGGALAGLTAPIIGIVSSILLYTALTKQVEANSQARVKNECDMIFLLLNQLDNEMSSFYTKISKGKIEKIYRGIEGFHLFCRAYRYEYDIEQFREHLKNDPRITFRAWYEGGQIAVLVDSFVLIEQRIAMSGLSQQLSKVFEQKLESYYDCKLSMSLVALSEAFEMYPFQKDDRSLRIQEFVERREQKNSDERQEKKDYTTSLPETSIAS